MQKPTKATLLISLGFIAFAVLIAPSCRNKIYPQKANMSGQDAQAQAQAPPQSQPAMANGNSADILQNRNSPPPNSGAPSAGGIPSQKISPQESLHILLQTMLAFSDHKRSMESFVANLKSLRLDPSISDDYNDYTGHLYIIRANNSYNGTRYLHAQYMSDQDGGLFLQHMSFEYQKGKQSIKQVVAELKALMPTLSQPTVSSADFIKWNLPDQQILWIKRLSAQDIADGSQDPFNAYLPEDEGTIRIAIEQEIHEGGD